MHSTNHFVLNRSISYNHFCKHSSNLHNKNILYNSQRNILFEINYLETTISIVALLFAPSILWGWANTISYMLYMSSMDLLNFLNLIEFLEFCYHITSTSHMHTHLLLAQRSLALCSARRIPAQLLSPHDVYLCSQDVVPQSAICASYFSFVTWPLAFIWLLVKVIPSASRR